MYCLNIRKFGALDSWNSIKHSLRLSVVLLAISLRSFLRGTTAHPPAHRHLVKRYQTEFVQVVAK